MDNPQPIASRSWSASLLERVDNIATRFEEALRAGRGPRIEDHLTGVPPRERTKLLFELLVVEIDHWAHQGGSPPLDDYLRRFPAAADQHLVQAAFAQAQADHRPGSVRPGQVLFDRYEVLTHLGSGATGAVWRVRERHSGKEYALKIEPVTDPDRLRRDYQLAEELRDDHVVTMRSLHLLDGFAYLCMDLVDGPDLRGWLAERGPLPLEQALGIAEQLAQALDQMHRKGMVHRDLKPANVVLVGEREHRPGVPFVVLVDLGLLIPAEASVYGQSIAAPHRQLAGTPPYMAPEQWQGRAITPAVDQWALAVILYQMTAGRLPFAGTTPGELCLQACGAEAECPTGLPAPQWAALQRALSKERQGRYPSCGAFLAALRAPEQEMSVVDLVHQSLQGFSLDGHAGRRAQGGRGGALLLAAAAGALLLYFVIKPIGSQAPTLPLTTPPAASGPRAQGDEKAAMEARQRACQGGDASACYRLGRLYEDGVEVNVDLRQAVVYYVQGCTGGCAPACSRAGFAYYEGHVVKKDVKLGAVYLQRGCDGGDPWGCDHLPKKPARVERTNTRPPPSDPPIIFNITPHGLHP